MGKKELSEKLRTYGGMQDDQSVLYSYDEYCEMHADAEALQEKLASILKALANISENIQSS